MLNFIFGFINSCWNSSSAQSIHAETHLQLNQFMLNLIFSSINTCWISSSAQFKAESHLKLSIQALSHLQLNQFMLIFSFINTCWISTLAWYIAESHLQLNQVMLKNVLSSINIKMNHGKFDVLYLMVTWRPGKEGIKYDLPQIHLFHAEPQPQPKHNKSNSMSYIFSQILPIILNQA